MLTHRGVNAQADVGPRRHHLTEHTLAHAVQALHFKPAGMRAAHMLRGLCGGCRTCRTGRICRICHLQDGRHRAGVVGGELRQDHRMVA